MTAWDFDEKGNSLLLGAGIVIVGKKVIIRNDPVTLWLMDIRFIDVCG